MDPMSSTESKLMWAAIILSLVLVMALGTLAVLSVLGQDDRDDNGDAAANTTSTETDNDSDSDADPDSSDNDPADAGDPASPQLAVGEFDPPVTVRCQRSTDLDQGYAVIITNQADATIDYVVSIELTVDGGRPLVASTEVPALAAGEQREVIVNAAGPGGRRISDCTIAAVQSDRRVLLANS